MKFFFFALAVVLSGCTTNETNTATGSAAASATRPVSVPASTVAPLDLLPFQGVTTLIMTPDPAGHPAFIAAVREAKSSIKLEMFHLTDPDVIGALVEAKKRGVKVFVILDGQSLVHEKFKKPYETLKDAGVNIVSSTTSYYRPTHSKLMIVDESTAIIGSMDLTKRAPVTRDFAVMLYDPKVISDLNSLFELDLKNAGQSEFQEPKSLDHRLVVSPINSRARLSKLISAAQRSLDITTENLGDPVIQDALKDAVAHSVKIRVIVPMCNRNSRPLYNYSYLAWLADHNIEVRVMPNPPSTKTPYMHAKVIVADNATAYVGSADLRTTSTTSAREVGLLFSEQVLISPLASAFEEDWKTSVTPPSPPPTDCPTVED